MWNHWTCLIFIYWILSSAKRNSFITFNELWEILIIDFNNIKLIIYLIYIFFFIHMLYMTWVVSTKVLVNSIRYVCQSIIYINIIYSIFNIINFLIVIISDNKING